MYKFGTDIVQEYPALTLTGEPTRTTLVTSGDLDRAGLKTHDFKPCPLCNGSTLTGHEERNDNKYVIAKVWCQNCGCSIQRTVKSRDDIAKGDDMIRSLWNTRKEQ